MGNKSKMKGATSKNFGVSLRKDKNGGAFGSKRWHVFEGILVQVWDKERKEWRVEKQNIALPVNSHRGIKRLNKAGVSS